MATVFFHIEVEDCLWDEVPEADDQMASRLEAECVKHASETFGSPVSTHGRRSTDGALICSFKANSLDRVRETVLANGIVEGNDQIISGEEYVIVRDFETWNSDRGEMVALLTFPVTN